jgi:hypothetical protein
MRSVALDLHAAAPSITLLTAPEFAIQESVIDLQSGWHARQKRNQSLPVRLSRSEIAEHCSGLYPMK